MDKGNTILIYGITGHTSGFGKYIAKRLVNEGHSVVGVSRTNGFDLTKDMSAIVHHLKDCDIIINNSSGGNVQAKLLEKLHHEYRISNKTVISVGSWITRVERSRIHDIDLRHYTDKSNLAAISSMINYDNTTIKSIHLSWGFHAGNPILNRYSELMDTTTVDQAVDELVTSTRK